MHFEVWGQRGSSVRFDWWPTGAARVAAPGAILVVVDVLSFTTAVGVAVERGITVYPAPWRDARADELATRENAVLAVARGLATAAHPWSLSPAGMRLAPFTPRLVLPSPNGSSIAAAAEGLTVVAASLRNAGLVGRWLRATTTEGPRPIAVIAAGERWPDGSLRPSLEDALGAGAVVSSLMAEPCDLALSRSGRHSRPLRGNTISRSGGQDVRVRRRAGPSGVRGGCGGRRGGRDRNGHPGDVRCRVSQLGVTALNCPS